MDKKCYSDCNCFFSFDLESLKWGFVIGKCLCTPVRACVIDRTIQQVITLGEIRIIATACDRRIKFKC